MLPGPETRFFTGRDPEEEMRRQMGLLQELALGVPDQWRQGEVRQEDAQRQQDLLGEQQDFDLRLQAQRDAQQYVQTLQQAIAQMQEGDPYMEEALRALRYYQGIATAPTGAEAMSRLGASQVTETDPIFDTTTTFDPSRDMALAVIGGTAGQQRMTKEAEDRAQARTIAQMQFGFDLDQLSMEQQNKFARELAVLNADLTRDLTKGEYTLRMKELLAQFGHVATEADLERSWQAGQNDKNRDTQLELQKMQLSAAARDSLLGLIARFNPQNPMEREQLEAIRNDPNYEALTAFDRLNVETAIRAQYTGDAQLTFKEKQAAYDKVVADANHTRTLADHQAYVTGRQQWLDGLADEDTLVVRLDDEANRGVAGLQFLGRLASAYERFLAGDSTPADEIYRNYFTMMGASEDSLKLVQDYISRANTNARNESARQQLFDQETTIALQNNDMTMLMNAMSYLTPREVEDIANMADDDPRLKPVGPGGQLNPRAQMYQTIRTLMQTDPIQATYIRREAALAEQVRNEPEVARIRGEVETLIKAYPEVQGTEAAANTLRGLLYELARLNALGDGTGVDPVEGPSAVTVGVIDSLVSGALRAWGDSREAFSSEMALELSNTLLNDAQAAYYNALAEKTLGELEGGSPGATSLADRTTVLDGLRDTYNTQIDAINRQMTNAGCPVEPISSWPDPETVSSHCRTLAAQLARVEGDLDSLVVRYENIWSDMDDADLLRRLQQEALDFMPDASPEEQGAWVNERFLDIRVGPRRSVVPGVGVEVRDVPRDPEVPENQGGAFDPNTLVASPSTAQPATPAPVTEEDVDRLDQELIAGLDPEVRGLVDEIVSGARDMPRPGTADLSRWARLAMEYGWPGTGDIDLMRSFSPAQRSAILDFQRQVTGAVNLLRQGQ